MLMQPLTTIPRVSDMDITDAWREAVDPENEYGEECRAFFEHDEGIVDDPMGRPVTSISVTLRAIRVSGDDGAILHDRDHAIKFLGYETVCRIEDIHETQTNW